MDEVEALGTSACENCGETPDQHTKIEHGEGPVRATTLECRPDAVWDRRIVNRASKADPELVRRAVAAAERGDTRKAEYWKAKAMRLNTASGVKQLARGVR